MEYRKESHFIVAYEGEQMKGKWNILTNEYIGVKGAVVKHKPVSFNYENMRNMNNVLRSALRLIENYCDRWHPFTPDRGQRLEEIISVGLEIDNNWSLWHDLTAKEMMPKLTKDFVSFIMDNYQGVYSPASISEYQIYKKHINFINKCPDHKTWAMCVLRAIKTDVIPTSFIEGMILRGIHEKVFQVKASSDYARLITHWYEMIITLDDKLEVKHNILTNYAILQWLYTEYKNAHYEENLRKNNDKPWLYYENDDYIVYPLLSRAAFHEEAESQHNCVERMYMEYVAEGKTYIVVVRKKQNPDRSYITCEVDHHGQICQYLYRNNNWVYNDKDTAFKTEYQNHLYSSLAK